MQDAYGLEKLATEELCMHYDKDFSMECRIARFHNIYGPYGTWKGGREKAPAAFCRKAICAQARFALACRAVTHVDGHCTTPQRRKQPEQAPGCAWHGAISACFDSGQCSAFSDAIHAGIQMQTAAAVQKAAVKPVAESKSDEHRVGLQGEVEMWGDGKQTRSFTFIDDCVEGVLRITKSDFKEPLNLGSTEMVSMNDMMGMVLGFDEKKLTTKHIPGPEGVRGRNSDNALILEKLGWEPTVKLQDGLKVRACRFIRDA